MKTGIKDRLGEATTYAGLGTLFLGISQIMQGDYATGVPTVVTSLLAIFKKEKGSN